MTQKPKYKTCNVQNLVLLPSETSLTTFEPCLVYVHILEVLTEPSEGWDYEAPNMSSVPGSEAPMEVMTRVAVELRAGPSATRSY